MVKGRKVEAANIGKNVAQICDIGHGTGAALARLMNSSRQHVDRLKHVADPSVSTALALARALDLTVEQVSEPPVLFQDRLGAIKERIARQAKLKMYLDMNVE